MRFRGQRPCQGDPLLLTTGQFMGISRRIVGHANLFQNGHNSVFGLGLIRQAKANILGNRHMRKQGVILENQTQIAVFRRDHFPLLRNRDAIQQDMSRRHGFQTCGNSKRRCLATTRRPQQAHNLTRMHLQVQPQNRRRDAIRMTDIPQFNNGWQRVFDVLHRDH